MTGLRFFIDENLSPTLVHPARSRGHEAMHVNHIGLRGQSDRELLRIVAAGDWILVPAARRSLQITLFEAALDDVGRRPDMANVALDVTLDGEGKTLVTAYDLP